MKRLLSVLLLLALIGGFQLPSARSEGLLSKYVWPITEVRLNKTSVGVYAGRTVQLLSKVSPASRSYEKVTFSSSDEKIAKVSAAGLITGISPGTCVITATAKGSMSYDTEKTAQCRVVVKNAPVKAFRLNAAKLYLVPSQITQLSVDAVSPSYAKGYTVKWASADPAVAAISDDGRVKGLKVGTTRVRATIGKKSVLCLVKVTNGDTPLAVAVSEKSRTMGPGETFKLSAKTLPEKGKDQAITWSSTRASVASVSSTGLVTALAPGKTQIRATSSNGLAAFCTVTVKKIPVSSVVLSESETQYLKKGGTRQLTARVYPENATSPAVTYASSRPEVASVNETTGLVTAHSVGTAAITAKTGNGKSDRVVFKVVGTQTAKVTITAAGDITLGGDPRKPASQVSSKAYYRDHVYKKYGNGLLSAVASAFSGDGNIGIANLECCFGTGTRYAKKTYVLQAPAEYAQILKSAGIDAIGHANNHTVDITTGATETKAAAKKYGIGYAGNGSLWTTEVNGIKVGMCAYSIVNKESGKVIKGVKKLRSSGCDIVVVQLHWGAEFSYSANSAMRALAHSAVNAGADLVLGHHQHVVSGIEKYNGKYIVYGLGTLSSSVLVKTTQVRDFDALIYQQTFTVDLESRAVKEDDAVKLIACSMSSKYEKESDDNNAHPTILTGSARNRVLSKVRYHSQKFSTLPDSVYQ